MSGHDERTHRRVTRSVLLPLSEIELRVSRSSGPGGQHANTSETRVEAVFDVEASTALTANQKHRVVARRRAMCCGQWRRTSGASSATASSRSTGSWPGSPTPFASSGSACRRSRREPRGSKRLEAKKRRSATKRLRRVNDGE